MPKAYELPAPGEPFDPELFKLGQPCKRNHIHADGLTLRYVSVGKCVQCERDRGLRYRNRCKDTDPDYHAKARERMAHRRSTDPDYNRNAAQYIAEKRKREGRKSRSKYGLPYQPRADVETALMRKAIRLAGRLPSVAHLVYEQQLQHWHDHPSDRLAAIRERAKHRARWRYMTDSAFRLYHRSKSKARKVAQRGGTPLHLSPTQLWRRWSDFDHCCAYCGAGGDLEVEHVVPISKGGEHHLGNIVPACHSCNSSKHSKDSHTWYKAQTFYSELQWNKIQSILNKSKPTTEQINLFAC